MSALREFFERLDAQLAKGLIEAEVSMDGKLPASQHGAERAGVDFDDLTDVIGERVTAYVNHLTVAMLDGSMPPLIAMRHLAVTTAREFFEAGVQWEQERHLPVLDLTPEEIELDPDIDPELDA